MSGSEGEPDNDPADVKNTINSRRLHEFTLKEETTFPGKTFTTKLDTHFLQPSLERVCDSEYFPGVLASVHHKPLMLWITATNNNN